MSFVLVIISAYAEGGKRIALAAVQTSSGKWGFIDTSGHFVIPAKYDKALSFSEGLAAVNVGYSTADINHLSQGRWGYIDPEGNWVIQPQFDDAQSFSEGMAVVSVGGKMEFWDAPTYAGGKSGYIDKTGKWRVQPQDQYKLYAFSEGLARIGSPGGYGYMDRNGKIVLSPVYYMAEDFHNGRAMIYAEFNHPQLIDRKGKVVLEYDDIKRGYTEGLTQVKLKEQNCLADTNGKCTVKLNAGVEVAGFSDGMGLASVSMNEEVMAGYIDHKGKWVISPKYRYATFFKEGVAVVDANNSGHYLLIDKSDRIVLEFLDSSLTDLQAVSGGMILLRKDLKWTYMNLNGHILPMTFAAAEDFKWVE